MAALKNLRHEFFCRTFIESPNEYVRFNALKSYMEVYPRATKKTAATNGSRLKAKCLDRLLELWEESLRRKDGYHPIDYRRGLRKKFKLDSQRNNPKSVQSQPSSIAQAQAQNTAKEDFHKSYQIPKHLIDKEAVNNSERDPWDVLLK